MLSGNIQEPSGGLEWIKNLISLTGTKSLGIFHDMDGCAPSFRWSLMGNDGHGNHHQILTTQGEFFSFLAYAFRAI